MDFPYGKAALVILIAAIASAAGLIVAASRAQPEKKPDIVFATFTKEHALAYRQVIPIFEKEHNCTVQLQVVNDRALMGRLQSAMQVGADVPDMVELQDGWMGIFSKGPIEDIGFVDLTDNVHHTDAAHPVSLFDKLVNTRFKKWSSRGHIFALPHDVHPTALAYNREVAEKLHIDVSKLTTWDEFVRVGREVAQNRDSEGNPIHYMIDLPQAGPYALRLLILQHGGGMFSGDGDAMFDNDDAIDVACWYAQQSIGTDGKGKNRIAFPCGWGQPLAKAVSDGLCVFYICPDWRTAQFEQNSPDMKGKMSLIPMPAWKPGGIQTSTWGATGLAFTKHAKNFDLAWQLGMYLYYDAPQLGPRFEKTNILPPFKPAWNQPQFSAPREYWGGIPLGTFYQKLAPEVPFEEMSAYMQQAEGKLWEAYGIIQAHYKDYGEAGLREFAAAELHRCANDVRRMIHRNVFLADDSKKAASERK